MSKHNYSPEDMIEDLGALLSGLQVPLSIGVTLGAAEAPLRRLYGELDSFGYPSKEEFADKVRTRLMNYGYTPSTSAHMRAANVDRPMPGLAGG